jgi:DNA-binding response OmpR family regulator
MMFWGDPTRYTNYDPGELAMDQESTERAETNEQPAAVEPLFGSQRPAGAPLSVLVADAEEMVQRVLRSAFERRGWFVCQAADGREALECVERDRFDLLVLDLNLAFINGFELLDALNQRPVERRARAVVLSAQTQPEPVLRAFELGADDFVEKPVNPEILIARIERLIRR